MQALSPRPLPGISMRAIRSMLKLSDIDYPWRT
jgi:hypothetical protein